MTEEKSYRCTRNSPYSVVGCLGHTDVSCRQGYYMSARNPLHAAMKMFASYPKDAFDGFTVQPKDREEDVCVWTIRAGIKFIGAGRVGSRGLPDGTDVETPEEYKKELVDGLRESLVQENHDKITLAAHRHRHGVSLLAYRAKRELFEEEIIELLGEDFEEGRDEEYIDDICSTTFEEVQFVEV